MNESIDERLSSPDADAPPSAEVAARVERMRILRSAFAAIAPSALTDEGRALSQAGRDLTRRLTTARESAAVPEAAALDRLDGDLDAFEASMRRFAQRLPVAQLRSTLPGRIGRDRRSVLDLLDLLLGGLSGSGADWAARIGQIDYLVTLLCTAGARASGRVVHDPVTLTPRLSAQCSEADASGDPRLEAAETEFFTAASMSQEELREEFQRRTLRQRKVELGPLFFGSRVLRAIVTYNAALLERVSDEIQDAGDWGDLDGHATGAGGSEPDAASIFESSRLRRLAAAARQRVLGASAPDSPEKRIVDALDFETLSTSEREALARETVGTAADPIGTAILVGLVCRSLAVLSIELQAFGLSPDVISDVWVGELAAVFERLIEDKRDHQAYRQAYALAELRNTLLLEPVAERLRAEHGTETVPPDAAASPNAAVGSERDRLDVAPSDRPDRTARSLPPAAPDPRAPRAPAPPPIAAAAGPAAAPNALPDRPATAAPHHASASARAVAPAATVATARRSRAGDLVREALVEDRRGREAAALRTVGRGRTLARLARAAVVLLVFASAFVVYRGRAGSDLRDFSRDQLGLVSPHLVDGRRNGDGHGPGFVGTLDASWDALSGEERAEAAEALVERLRAHGLEQVMVYDRHRALRIQAVGSQPIRTL